MRHTRNKFSALILVTAVMLAAVPDGARGGSPFDRLGISSVECDCSFTVDASGTSQRWVFHAEPRVVEVDRRGPARGHIEPGDYIVAIDGKLVTTGEGGRRFTAIAGGEPVVLTLRRDGRVVDERITPRAAGPGSFDVSAFQDFNNQRMVDLSDQVEELSRLAVEMQRLKMKDLPDLQNQLEGLQGLEALQDLDLRLEGLDALQDINLDGLKESLLDLQVDLGALQEASPAGSFGMGISFGGSIKRQDDGPAQWRFDDPPAVTTVEFGSPAARAGIRTGDVLTEIDGVALDSREGGERFSRIEPGQSVEFTVERDDSERTVTMTAVERPESRRRFGGFDWRVHRHDAAQFSMTMGGTRFDVYTEGSVQTVAGDDDNVVVIKTPDGTFELRRVKD